MVPQNHVGVDGGSDRPWEGAILTEQGRPIVNYRDYRPCGAVMRSFCRITLTSCFVIRLKFAVYEKGGVLENLGPWPS